MNGTQVFLAIGSNLGKCAFLYLLAEFLSFIGDRLVNFRQAIQSIRSNIGPIVNSSFLYETAPQYVTNQPYFLNAILEVITQLDPIILLEVNKFFLDKIHLINVHTQSN
jgi:7,8-dihydro-6-hydroxymethylpterin-pyrophosphokinase